jgi:hypothetical protein
MGRNFTVCKRRRKIFGKLNQKMIKREENKLQLLLLLKKSFLMILILTKLIKLTKDI